MLTKKLALFSLSAVVRAGFLSVAISLPAAAAEPGTPLAASGKPSPMSTASHGEISRWIDELDHDAFTVRQVAASRLLAAGMAAREPLLAIVDGPDPETRAAARRLIALIDQTEFHRRLEAFAADTEGRQGLTLPGWEQYQKLVGGDPPARALFVDMQRQEGALISAALGATKRPPGDLLESRLVRLVQWQAVASGRAASPPVASCAAMLFLGSVAEIDLSENAAALIEVLLQRPPILESLRSVNRQDPVRRLVVGWVLHCPNKNEEILRRRLSIISNAGLEEALPLALGIITGDPQFGRVQASTRAEAVRIIGQLGRLEHVEQLEPLLEDTSVCFPPQMRLPGQAAATVQVRDVALVVMLQLTEQRPADYGYVNAQLQRPKALQVPSLFRDNDQQRAEAIAKWRQWRTAQKNGGR